jgi:hypothetical protein
MISIDIDSAKPITGDEGTQIMQIFHPHNTMLGVRYSIVRCVLEPGKKSRAHILKSSEENTGAEPLEFLCIVDPAWKKDDETIAE